MMKTVYLGHMGVEKHFKESIIFWLRMFSDIKKMILECRVCLERGNAIPKEPLISHKYSVAVDYISK